MTVYLQSVPVIIYIKRIWWLFTGMIFAGMSSSDSDSSSIAIAASNKILVPGGQGDGTLSSTDQLENPETVLEDSQVCVWTPHCRLKFIYVGPYIFVEADFLVFVVLMSYISCRNKWPIGLTNLLKSNAREIGFQ